MGSNDGQAIDQLRAFAALLVAEPDLGRQVRTCEQPHQILDLAASRGFTLSQRLLRDQATNLSAAHWPWAGKGSTWRRSFFSR